MIFGRSPLDDIWDAVGKGRALGRIDGLLEAKTLAERFSKEAAEIGLASRYRHVREGQSMLASAYREVADEIEKLLEPRK